MKVSKERMKGIQSFFYAYKVAKDINEHRLSDSDEEFNELQTIYQIGYLSICHEKEDKTQRRRLIFELYCLKGLLKKNIGKEVGLSADTAGKELATAINQFCEAIGIEE